MKRKLSSPADGFSSSRRRQPQTSCDFCRAKKLKCDRSEPCSNCVARGVTCQIEGVDVQANPPDSSIRARDPPRQNIVVNGDVLERLRRLEETVYGTDSESAHKARLDAGANLLALRRFEPMDSRVDDGQKEPRRTAKGKEINYAINSDGLATDHPTLLIRVLPSHLSSSSSNTPYSTSASDSASISYHRSSYDDKARPIYLPSRTDALLLFNAYALSTTSVQHKGHTPTTRTTLSDMYSRLAHNRQVDPGSVALLLSICAATAFYWHPSEYRSNSSDPNPIAHAFESQDDASRQSLSWRNAAWDVLDPSRRGGEGPGSGHGSLEGVQAMMILGDLLYNTEGCSSRWRGLQSSALSTAKEIGLHLVDLPCSSSSSPEGSGDTPTIREIKRRVWWYIAGTDWLLSTMGGPTDRTYSIHPRHFCVRYPRELNDEELETCDDASQPDHAGDPTDSTYLKARIALAEMCRHICDVLPLGGGDVDDLAFEELFRLEGKMEGVMRALPVFFRSLDRAEMPERLEGKERFEGQRRVLHMSFHARRAKLFRPFLETRSYELDKRKTRFRDGCRESARRVLDIAGGLLEESLGSTPRSGAAQDGKRSDLAAHRSGMIVSHLFMACAVLATDPSLRSTETGWEDGDDSDGYDVKGVKAALTRACRLLERAGEQSAVAACMLGRLVLVLDRYRVGSVERGLGGFGGNAMSAQGTDEVDGGGDGQKGIDNLLAADGTGDRNSYAGGRSMLGQIGQHETMETHQPHAHQHLPQQGGIPAFQLRTNGGHVDPAMFSTQQFGGQPSIAMPSRLFSFAYPDTAAEQQQDGFGLTDLWDDFLSSSVPMQQDVWGQMINQLDYFGAPV